MSLRVRWWARKCTPCAATGTPIWRLPTQRYWCTQAVLTRRCWSSSEFLLIGPIMRQPDQVTQSLLCESIRLRRLISSCASLVTPTEVVNESTQYSMNERVLPLWQAAGLSADPGGLFDVVATVVTTDVTTGTGKLGVRVGFVN